MGDSVRRTRSIMPRQASRLVLTAFAVLALAASSLGPPADRSTASRLTEWVSVSPPTQTTAPPTPTVTPEAPSTPETTVRHQETAASTPDPGTEPAEAWELPEGAFVAAPLGSASAAGTLEDPIDLATALSEHSPVRPGGMVFLRGGTYHGTFTSHVNGTPEAPIEFRSFPGEWVALDGGERRDSTLTINGSDTIFTALEIKKSDPERRASTAASRPPNFARAEANGVDVYGQRTRLQDLIVRDHRHGIGLWRRAVDAEVRGAVVFNNGFVNPDRGRGHGIYIQNREGTKRLSDSLVFNNFGFGIHAYGLNNYVNGLVVEGVTSFENGAPSGERYPNLFVGTSINPVDGVTIKDNILYHVPSVQGRNLQVGYGSAPNLSAVISGNTVSGGTRVLKVMNFQNLAVSNNTFHVERDASETRFLVDLQGSSGRYTSYAWDQNAYLDRSGSGSQGPFSSFLINGSRAADAIGFGRWRSGTGADQASTYTTERPTATDVRVRPTATGSAIITVLNWSRHPSATVDLSEAGLSLGSPYEIRNAEDFFGEPVVSGVWDGGPVEVPLGGSSIVHPYGAGGHPVERTPIDFAAFVLKPL